MKNNVKNSLYHFFEDVQGSTKDTIMYLVPLVTSSPSCKCVNRPGCISIQPTFMLVTLQLYLMK